MSADLYGPEIRIRIGGPAGFGIKAAGATLARLFAASGYHTFDLTEYPSLIKGGHNTYHLRVSARPVHSHVMPTDLLVCLDGLTFASHLGELTRGAAVVYDPGEFTPDDAQRGGRDDLCFVPVDLAGIVREAGGVKIMRNVAALGAVLGVLEQPIDGLESSLRAQFAHKEPEIAERNIAIARAGFAAVADAGCTYTTRLGPPEPSDGPRALLDGNEAIGLGALAAGVGLYCAYPMTPASSLLHFMAKHADSQGVVVKHTEDEIAAMNMVLGGAWGGTRSMCATSGGGFSLMVEAFGFAGVSESPVVVGLFTRPGPATGLPTWTEQSDLRFALHAAQGEFPRVVLAPGDHFEAFEVTWKAFNLADELQTPVIILGDSYLSDNTRTCPAPDSSTVSISRGKLVETGSIIGDDDTLVGGRYARYRVTEDGISVRALPGVEGAVQLVNSYEHDEFGYGAAGETIDNRSAQNEKRLRKSVRARELVPAPRHYGTRGGVVSLVAFGSTKMPALQALEWLSDEGISAELLHIVTLEPFPAEEVGAYLDAASLSLVVEGNATGQLEGLVRQHCLLAPDHHLRRSDGRPISPELIYATVKGLLGSPVTLTAAGALAEGDHHE
jgi:2-oxoglutarate ferredoxin oxidoreductase subunit alpha